MTIKPIEVSKSIEVIQFGKRTFWYRVGIGADLELGEDEKEKIDELTKIVDEAFERNLPPEGEITAINTSKGDMVFR